MEAIRVADAGAAPATVDVPTPPVQPNQVLVRVAASSINVARVPTLTPHDPGDAAASLTVQASADVSSVQRQLGHASAAVTLDGCADHFDDDLDAIAERLDERLTRSNFAQLRASTTV